MTEKSTSVRRNDRRLPRRNLEFWWVAEKATECDADQIKIYVK